MPIFTGNPNVMPPRAQFVPPRGTMPVPPWFFPWMYGMPGAEFPKEQTERFGRTPRGLLDQRPDIKPEIDRQTPNPWAAQNIADIYSFPKKGLLGVPGTEGGGRGMEGGGGRGLLGSKWRDPRFIQQYETQQGLKPGSLQPVTPPPPEGRVVPGPTGTGWLRRPPSMPEGPTPAQMARPVQQTPEISAKLAQARADRAAKQLATATDLERIGRSMGISQKNMMYARDGTAAAGMTPTPANIQYWIAQMRAQGLFKPEVP